MQGLIHRHIKFSELVDAADLQALMDSMQQVIGIANAIIDVDGVVITCSGWQDVCVKYHRVNSATCARCIESDTSLVESMLKGAPFAVYGCLNGLVDTAAPIMVEGQHVANVFTGQFFTAPPDLEFFRQQAQKFGFDEKNYLEAVGRVPVISEDRVKSITQVYANFARVLATNGLDRLHQRDAENRLALLNHELAQRVRERTEELYEKNRQLLHDEEALRASEAKLHAILDNSPVGIWLVGVDRRYRFVNKTFCNAVGIPESEFLATTHLPDLLGDEIAANCQDTDRECLAQDTPHLSYETLPFVDGKLHLMEVTKVKLCDEAGEAIGAIGIAVDITERKQAEEQVMRLAHYDVLTDLPNRTLFLDRLGQEIKKSNRTGLALTLLYIDLDQFKEVNDTLGHNVGDALLVDAAQRIVACVRESDTVARLGGDEFTVILAELADPKRVDILAESIIQTLNEPFILGGETIYISASVGITSYPTDAVDADTLLMNADQAMYVAKNSGRNRYSYFTNALQEKALIRLQLVKDLRGAMVAGQFQLHFQPIVELATGYVYKAEALLRWKHPVRGMVGPAEFIPLAEETGLIHEIGDWVFKESVRWAKRWIELSPVGFQVSVNKSPVQFLSEINHNDWLDHLEKIGLAGTSVVIEITEGLLLNAGTSVSEKLLRFREAGLQVAIDDFGTGYSALSYLKKFDIDYLKIDQSFVRNLATDHSDLALSEAIIVMAHKLGLKVIAEGVETTEQRDLLAAAGCDYVQGYLYAKAMPAEEFEALLKTQRY